MDASFLRWKAAMNYMRWHAALWRISKCSADFEVRQSILGAAKNCGALSAPKPNPTELLSVVQAEKEEPHPQVVVAFGFLITNCAPSRFS